jgi:uncharacterized protein YifE (UPF0438 family)
MCTQRAPANYSQQIYARHGETLRRFLSQKTLPRLQHRHGEYLLAELGTL